MKCKNKVFAYITRGKNEATELLVFKHRDYPEAGIQVPAGTVEIGENHVAALKREIEEESGLTVFSDIRYLGHKMYWAKQKDEIHHRYFYQLRFRGESLEHFRHIVTGTGEDQDLVFDYSWVNLRQLPPLIAQHGQMVGKIF